MKKVAIALAVAGGVALSGTAGADRLDLSGSISQQCEVRLGGNNGQSVALNDQASSPVGTVTYTCNAKDGFTATVESANAGVLEDSTGTYSRGYRISIADGDAGSSAVNGSGINLATTYSKTVAGFQPDVVDGSTHSLSFRTVAGPALPGGVTLTDAVTFLVTGDY